MCSRVEAAEQLRSALQVDLAEAERSREALWEEKTHLETQLRKAEETGAELQAELRGAREEKEELKEKLNEVRGHCQCHLLAERTQKWHEYSSCYFKEFLWESFTDLTS